MSTLVIRSHTSLNLAAQLPGRTHVIHLKGACLLPKFYQRQVQLLEEWIILPPCVTAESLCRMECLSTCWDRVHQDVLRDVAQLVLTALAPFLCLSSLHDSIEYIFIHCCAEKVVDPGTSTNGSPTTIAQRTNRHSAQPDFPHIGPPHTPDFSTLDETRMPLPPRE